MSGTALTKMQLAELDYVERRTCRERGNTWYRVNTADPYDGNVSNTRVAWALVRKGLLRVQTFSEQFRGEPRFVWHVFHITDAGKTALASAQKRT